MGRMRLVSTVAVLTLAAVVSTPAQNDDLVSRKTAVRLALRTAEFDQALVVAERLKGDAPADPEAIALYGDALWGSGLFDECPNVKIVLGHLGEGIPANLWRIDHRNGWMKAPHKYPAKHGVAHYFRKHFHLTTSGNFDTAALINAISVMGPDRVMFSVDWPFEDVGEGSQWIDTAEISESDRIKVGRTNAVKLFKLPLR